MNPTFDSDGYPSDETLRNISYWYTFNGYTPKEFFQFCEEAFNKHYGSWKIVENYNNDLLPNIPYSCKTNYASCLLSILSILPERSSYALRA